MPKIVGWLQKEIEKIVKWFQEMAVELVVWVIGWLVCVSFVALGFGIGRWAAPHLGWDGSRDTFGLHQLSRLCGCTSTAMRRKNTIDCVTCWTDDDR